MLRAIPKQIIILIILGVVLFGAIIYFLIGPRSNQVGTANLPAVLPSPAVVLPPQVPKIPLRNITFGFGPVVLPETAKVYVIQRTVDQNWAEAIAETFDFTGQAAPQFDTDGNQTITWRSSDNLQSLAVTLDLGYLEYNNANQPLKSDFGDAPQVVDSPSRAATTAVNFLKEHGLYPPDITPTPSNITFFRANATQAVETNSFAEANLYQVTFTRQLDKTLVYQQFANPAQISVWVNKYSMVTKVIYQYPVITQRSSRDYQLLTVDEAKDALIRGNGVVVNFEPGAEDPRTTHELLSANITRVRFGYFNDSQSTLLQPIFVFEGTGNFKDIGSQPLTIYLPAIRNEEAQ